ncbi:hypothetical protein WGM54_28125, partial [Paenibacillus polymyxa]|uniref:hypothetical protein n=1 Tax=Paenibacillus polymyxa TaxID=1406 RepID=UPI00307D6FF2
IELREGRLEGALVGRSGELSSASKRIVVKTRQPFPGYQCFDQSGQVLSNIYAAPLGLYRAMGEALSVEQRNALALESKSWSETLRDRLATLAINQTETAATFIGQRPPASWMRLPERLQDGRVGFPLSGRGVGRGAPLGIMVRELYPTFSDAEIDSFVAGIRSSGANVWMTLRYLQQELTVLTEVLGRWERAAQSSDITASRRRFASELRRCWRRQTVTVPVGGERVGHQLRIERERIGNLPELPASVSFSHVSEVV